MKAGRPPSPRAVNLLAWGVAGSLIGFGKLLTIASLWTAGVVFAASGAAVLMLWAIHG